MSFTFLKQGSQKDVVDALAERPDVPDVVADFVSKAFAGYHNDKQMVMVSSNGHLHDGSDYDVSSLTIRVQKTNELHPSFRNEEAKAPAAASSTPSAPSEDNSE